MRAVPHLTVDTVGAQLSSAETAAPGPFTTQLGASAASSASGSSLPTLSPLTLHTPTTPDTVPQTQLRVLPPLPSFPRPDPVLDLTASSPAEDDVPASQGSSCSSADGQSRGETTERRGSSDWVFVHRLYDMLTDERNEPWIAFSESGDTFTVFDPDAFAQNVLPRYFRHRNFQSFVRQLNLYNFSKVVTARSVPRAKPTKGEQETWEFQNPDFHRDRPEDVDLIRRRGAIGSSPTRSRRNSKAQSGRTFASDLAPQPNYQLNMPPRPALASRSSSQIYVDGEPMASSGPFALPFVPPVGFEPPAPSRPSSSTFRPPPRQQPSYPPSTLPRRRSRTAPSPTSHPTSRPYKSTSRRPLNATTPDELDALLDERKSLHSTVKKYRFDLGVLSYQVREGQARMRSLLQLTWQLKQLVKQLGGEAELANFPFHVFDPRLADFSVPLSVIENDFATKSVARAPPPPAEASSTATGYDPRFPSPGSGYAFPQQESTNISDATTHPSSVPPPISTSAPSSHVDAAHTTFPSGLTVPATSPRTRSHSAPEQGIRRYDSYESAYSLPETQLAVDQATDFAYEPAEPVVDDSWTSTYLPKPPTQYYEPASRYSSRPASSLGGTSISTSMSTNTSARGSYSSEGSSLASSFVEVPMHDTYDAQLQYSTLGQVLQGGSTG
ncbi:Proteophosphoglycan ppg4 [Rhodotorula toruloides ATCC 204091]|uniref:HSF-type DNA-binding-domain containing protein n=1 Tax=Rhodotorula toruloides TaxID=5286 RepID=A0A2T0A361_RHOTO|nr:Proteophosphoglycan ppg4 [Rhodotorula toruloides ATCC 204091]KAK4334090.1 Proteophosphoglycan ppg4 [Rhodotorula toruloides]PRQ72396.1 HSF-type DNA-binding-domain containing protein [Rhodotorula toruloides]